MQKNSGEVRRTDMVLGSQSKEVGKFMSKGKKKKAKQGLVNQQKKVRDDIPPPPPLQEDREVEDRFEKMLKDRKYKDASIELDLETNKELMNQLRAKFDDIPPPPPPEPPKHKASSRKAAAFLGVEEDDIGSAAIIEEAAKEADSVYESVGELLEIIGQGKLAEQTRDAKKSVDSAKGIGALFKKHVGDALLASYTEMKEAKDKSGRLSFSYIWSAVKSISKIWTGLKEFRVKAKEDHPGLEVMEKLSAPITSRLSSIFSALSGLSLAVKLLAGKNDGKDEEITKITNGLADESMKSLVSAGNSLKSMISMKIAKEDIGALGISPKSITDLAHAAVSDLEPAKTFVKKAAELAKLLPASKDAAEKLIPSGIGTTEQRTAAEACRKAIIAIGDEVSTVKRAELTAVAISKYTSMFKDKDKIPKPVKELSDKLATLGDAAKKAPKVLEALGGRGLVEVLKKFAPKDQARSV